MDFRANDFLYIRFYYLKLILKIKSKPDRNVNNLTSVNDKKN